MGDYIEWLRHATDRPDMPPSTFDPPRFIAVNEFDESQVFLRIGEKLGSGSRGSVYAATATNNSTARYAVKFIGFSQQGDYDSEAFLAEVTILRYLCTKPNADKMVSCIRNVGFIMQQNLPQTVVEGEVMPIEPIVWGRLVMDHGQDMEVYIKNVNSIMRTNTIHPIMLSILSSLEFIHSYDIYHLDLKMKNVIIIYDSPGVVSARLIDFDLACFGGRASAEMSHEWESLREGDLLVGMSNLLENSSDAMKDEIADAVLLLDRDPIDILETDMCFNVTAQLQYLAEKEYYVFPRVALARSFTEETPNDAGELLAKFRDQYAFGLLYTLAMTTKVSQDIFYQTFEKASALSRLLIRTFDNGDARARITRTMRQIVPVVPMLETAFVRRLVGISRDGPRIVPYNEIRERLEALVNITRRP